MRVGIAGGGIAGLASAAFLARAGHEVHVFERMNGIAPDGTGILLQPAGIDVLRHLGLEEAAFLLGTSVTRMVARERGGGQLMELRYADLDENLRALGIRRPDLASLLLEAARSTGAALHFGAPLSGLREENGVSLVERDGARVHGPFDLVLVCDGTGSRLREQVVADARVRPHPRGVFSVVVPMHPALRADTLLQRVNAMRDGAGLLPIGRGTGDRPLVSFFWNARAADLPQLKRDGFAAWCDYIEEFCPEAREFLRALGSFDALTFATTAEVSMRRWHGARALVMGDAAHALNPQLGLGATMALLDAQGLSACLQDSHDVSTALAAYQALRKPHVDRYARVSRVWSRLDSSGFLSLRRRMFLAMANSPGPLRRRFLRHVCGYAFH